ncbi:MAG: glycosyltransferase family 9 protein [Bacteroidia bacterium]
MKQKRALIFFSAGLGDTVLLIPLIKHLKNKGFLAIGFFNSTHPFEEIFSEINLLDEIIVRKSKLRQFIFSLTNLFKYDKAYINYFAANRINLLTATICSKQIFINRKVGSILFRLFSFKINYIEPVKNIHDAQQNLNLLDSNTKVSLPDFYINFNDKKGRLFSYPYIVVQISAGNNKIAYKNWPIIYWISFLKMILEQNPETNFVLLGDKNEIELADKIKVEFIDNVHSLVGETILSDAMRVLYHAELFIGLDGGLMHMAVALKKPTFTIWGPSSIILYGYEKFSPIHKCVSLNLSCNPCSAWINVNHTKTISPEKCPDHACLQQLMPQVVFNQLKHYVNSLPIYAE